MDQKLTFQVSTTKSLYKKVYVGIAAFVCWFFTLGFFLVPPDEDLQFVGWYILVPRLLLTIWFVILSRKKSVTIVWEPSEGTDELRISFPDGYEKCIQGPFRLETYVSNFGVHDTSFVRLACFVYGIMDESPELYIDFKKKKSEDFDDWALVDEIELRPNYSLAFGSKEELFQLVSAIRFSQTQDKPQWRDYSDFG